MGVPGLWPLLHAAGTDHALPSLTSCGILGDALSPPSSSPPSASVPTAPKAWTLGIDVSLWLFHSRSSQGGHNAQLRLLFYRLARLASLPQVQPLFVFDGPLRPFEKRGRQFHGATAPGGGYARHPLQSDLIRIIKAFGFIAIVAPAEAEAELAEMNRNGEVDAIMTDDVDSFVFGARTVIRNWGSTLGGSQARARRARQAEAEEEDVVGPSATQQQTALPSSTQCQQVAPGSSALAAQYGENLVTVYRASSWEKVGAGKGKEVDGLQGLSTNGFILVALMAGGDYDVKGLCKCGIKIAMGLALCGFGDSLVQGFKKHCSPPPIPSASGGHLPSPVPSPTWSRFLEDWLDEVRNELRTNSQGHMTTRHAKLAASRDLSEFLGTKASLAVLGSLVWPITRGRMNEARGQTSTTTRSSEEGQTSSKRTRGSIDVPDLAGLCQRLFQWPEEAVVSKLRNVVWAGHIGWELVSGGGGGGDEADEIQALVTTIHGRRSHPSTGGLEEVRVEIDVRPLVEQAKSGIDPDLVTALELAEGEEDWVAFAAAATSGTQAVAIRGSSSTDSDSGPGDAAPPSSPAKRRKEQDQEAPLRIWLPLWALSQHHHTSKLLHTYEENQRRKKGEKEAGEERRRERREREERKEREGARQRGIDKFFKPAPAPKPSSAGAGMLGKRAPQGRSRTMPVGGLLSFGRDREERGQHADGRAGMERTSSSKEKRSGTTTSIGDLLVRTGSANGKEADAIPSNARPPSQHETRATQRNLASRLPLRSSFARRAALEDDSSGNDSDDDDVVCLDASPLPLRGSSHFGRSNTTPSRTLNPNPSSDSDILMASPHAGNKGAAHLLSSSSSMSMSERCKETDDIIARAKRAETRLMAASFSSSDEEQEGGRNDVHTRATKSKGHAASTVGEGQGGNDDDDDDDDDDKDMTLPSPRRFLQRALQGRTRSAPVGNLDLDQDLDGASSGPFFVASSPPVCVEPLAVGSSYGGSVDGLHAIVGSGGEEGEAEPISFFSDPNLTSSSEIQVDNMERSSSPLPTVLPHSEPACAFTSASTSTSGPILQRTSSFSRTISFPPRPRPRPHRPSASTEASASNPSSQGSTTSTTGSKTTRPKPTSSSSTSMAQSQRTKQTLLTERFVVLPKRNVAGVASVGRGPGHGAKTTTTRGRKSQPIVIDDED